MQAFYLRVDNCIDSLVKEITEAIDKELSFKNVRKYKTDNLTGIKKYFENHKNTFRVDLDVIQSKSESNEIFNQY